MKGYEILDYNYHCRYGEIDLIIKSGDGTVVFVEVKARMNNHYGYGAEAVNYSKCKKIKRTAKQYIFEKGLNWNAGFRFDVIVITNQQLEHIVNAFY